MLWDMSSGSLKLSVDIKSRHSCQGPPISVMMDSNRTVSTEGEGYGSMTSGGAVSFLR